MKTPDRIFLTLTATLLLAAAPSLAHAQDDAEAVEEAAEAVEENAEEIADEAEEVAEEAEEAQEEAEEEEEEAQEEAEEEEEEEEDEEEESAHGSYEWKPSYGIGLESGVWFNDLERWNGYVLEGNSASRFDHAAIWHLDLALEASFLEGTRLTLFGGYQSPFGEDPAASAAYIGIEPAFAFRREMWEIAIGVGVGYGVAGLEADEGQMDATLVLLRPFLEVRRYLNDWSGIYGRFGFNQWMIDDPEFEGELELYENAGEPISDDNLNEGGAYLALGVRFGHYPEHLKIVGDADEDGYRDDVDTCPEEPEDFDEFEDEDGCPEADNDEDGILDADDQCPVEPEDIDGWQDEDGCPETDDDTDGDGILNPADQCPELPEDVDGFEDEDGCPDPDNDNDGVADVDDQCPNQAGVAERQGCPFKRVVVTLKAIQINEKVFFEKNKAKIQEQSFDLLNEVAQVINDNPRIKVIEIQGHTSTEGSEAHNQQLSEARAEAVRGYLLERGVTPERLTSKGYGESTLLVPLDEDGEESAEAKERNRRVEFIILEQDEVTREVREDQVPEDAAEVEPAE